MVRTPALRIDSLIYAREPTLAREAFEEVFAGVARSARSADVRVGWLAGVLARVDRAC